MQSKAQAHVIAYHDHLGGQWLLGHITQAEYERLSGRKVARRLA
jgi:hypothetical protein